MFEVMAVLGFLFGLSSFVYNILIGLVSDHEQAKEEDLNRTIKQLNLDIKTIKESTESEIDIILVEVRQLEEYLDRQLAKLIKSLPPEKKIVRKKK